MLLLLFFFFFYYYYYYYYYYFIIGVLIMWPVTISVSLEEARKWRSFWIILSLRTRCFRRRQRCTNKTRKNYDMRYVILYFIARTTWRTSKLALSIFLSVSGKEVNTEDWRSWFWSFFCLLSQSVLRLLGTRIIRIIWENFSANSEVSRKAVYRWSTIAVC